MVKKVKVLPVIVFAQFCCTSLWFAGNGVMNELQQVFNLSSASLGHLTSAVQLGFIAGTLIFAFLSIADRFSPSKVFFYCAILGAIFNIFIILDNNTFETLLMLRFLTGFSLAGIYPVGMKIASDYFKEGLGTSLGYLVGALVLGTAFPHLLNFISGDQNLPWKFVLILTSSLAAMGGVLIFILVSNGPFRESMYQKDFSAFFKVFKIPKFRAAAIGYFGHMWELYALWAFLPVLLFTYKTLHPEAVFNVSLISFLVIGIGGLACIAGGYVSQYLGTKKTAGLALLISGICCLLSPLVFFYGSWELLIIFLLIWGTMVVADSPLFSTLVAQNAPANTRGTALTIVNSIGFAITVISIQLLNFLSLNINLYLVFLLLALGPVAGLIGLYKRTRPVR